MAARKAKAGSAFDRLNKMTVSGSLAGLSADAPATEEPAKPSAAPEVEAETPAAEFNEAAATSPLPAPSPVVEVISPRHEEAQPPHDPRGAPVAPHPAQATEVPQRVPQPLGMPEAQPKSAPTASEVTHVSPAAPPVSQVVLGSLSGGQGLESEGAAIPVRRNASPSFTQGSGLGRGLAANLPTPLADKVRDLPVAYRELAASYRSAKDTRTGKTLKRRNIRFHTTLATSLRRQLVHDKRLLTIRDLVPSYYVDAALTFMRSLPTAQFIEAADQFRDRLVGADAGFEAPNHYSISQENDDWLEEMKDELMLAGTKGLHGHMINAIVEAFLNQLNQERPAED